MCVEDEVGRIAFLSCWESSKPVVKSLMFCRIFREIPRKIIGKYHGIVGDEDGNFKEISLRIDYLHGIFSDGLAIFSVVANLLENFFHHFGIVTEEISIVRGKVTVPTFFNEFFHEIS